MDAKEYLTQIKDIDEDIKDVLAVIEEKEERAQRTTSAINTYMIPSGAKRQMADEIDEYVDIERGELRELIQKRQKIIDTIKLLPSKERGVLFKRYVLGCEFYEIATAYDRSESWAKTMHRTALKNLQRVLDERECTEFDRKGKSDERNKHGTLQR